MLNSASVASVHSLKCVIIGDPSPGHCPMGLGRSLDLRWMEKMVGGKRELDDRVVCCKVPWTETTAEQLIVAIF